MVVYRSSLICLILISLTRVVFIIALEVLISVIRFRVSIIFNVFIVFFFLLGFRTGSFI